MAAEKVTAQFNYKEDGEDKRRDISASFDFGEDLPDAEVLFGAESVFHHARSSLRVSFQSYLRSLAGQNLTEDEIQGKVNEWTPPSGRARGMSKLEKAKETLLKMSEEDRAAFAEELGLTA